MLLAQARDHGLGGLAEADEGQPPKCRLLRCRHACLPVDRSILEGARRGERHHTGARAILRRGHKKSDAVAWLPAVEGRLLTRHESPARYKTVCSRKKTRGNNQD